MKSLYALLLSCLAAVAASAASLPLRTALLRDVQMEQPAVSHNNDSATNGMAWRWVGLDRRDYGQVFTASEDFTADQLAVQALFSDHFRGNSRAPFRLLFLRLEDGQNINTREPVAEFSGELPPNVGIPHDQPAWLVMDFAPVRFKAGGTYAAVLQFADSGSGTQMIILRVTPSAIAQGGYGISSVDGQTFNRAPSVNFILGTTSGQSDATTDGAGRVLRVDRRGGAAYTTIAQAAAVARAGDTIVLAAGSGPYREVLHIRHSGTAEQPIVFDGSGETVTGFEPLAFVKTGGQWVADLKPFFASVSRIQGFSRKDGKWVGQDAKAFPAVLVHKGRRILQDAQSGEFTSHVQLSEDGLTLTLLPDISPEGWEISSRDAVVIVLDNSHQVFRNLTASGSLNDGFNLHGRGTGLVFENIRGIQNLDEGFSAHDAIECSIVNGVFAHNDNGIGNVAESVMTASNIRIFDNVGFGLWLFNCSATLEHVTAWGNGVAQIAFHGNSVVELEDVAAVRSGWSAKPWISAQESATRSRSETYECSAKVKVNGRVAILD